MPDCAFLALVRLVQDAFAPSVDRYLPPFPDWPGNADWKACCWTKAVVATWVVFVPGLAVGAVGAPVRAGDASGAFSASAPST